MTVRVDPHELWDKSRKRGLTGACEFQFTNLESDRPKIIRCNRQARFYKDAEVGLFGMFICDDCFEKKYLNA